MECEEKVALIVTQWGTKKIVRGTKLKNYFTMATLTKRNYFMTLLNQNRLHLFYTMV